MLQKLMKYIPEDYQEYFGEGGFTLGDHPKLEERLSGMNEIDWVHFLFYAEKHKDSENPEKLTLATFFADRDSEPIKKMQRINNPTCAYEEFEKQNLERCDKNFERHLEALGLQVPWGNVSQEMAKQLVATEQIPDVKIVSMNIDQIGGIVLRLKFQSSAPSFDPTRYHRSLTIRPIDLKKIDGLKEVLNYRWNEINSDGLPNILNIEPNQNTKAETSEQTQKEKLDEIESHEKAYVKFLASAYKSRNRGFDKSYKRYLKECCVDMTSEDLPKLTTKLEREHPVLWKKSRLISNDS